MEDSASVEVRLDALRVDVFGQLVGARHFPSDVTAHAVIANFVTSANEETIIRHFHLDQESNRVAPKKTHHV